MMVKIIDHEASVYYDHDEYFHAILCGGIRLQVDDFAPWKYLLCVLRRNAPLWEKQAIKLN
jgi:hypothetical protein